ncbi:MAG: substrate-binding domain-containing protein [Fimbriimonadales bacterium]|nr:substrate-binding domain-containing protein [Fimbriimonadales bacterium]
MVAPWLRVSWIGSCGTIRDRIECGESRLGDRLPYDPKLAQSWVVSKPTAPRPLAGPRRQGLLERAWGAGAVVADRSCRRNGRVALIVDRMDPRCNFPHTDPLRGIQDALDEETGLVVARLGDDPRRNALVADRFSSDAGGILIDSVGSTKNDEAFHRGGGGHPDRGDRPQARRLCADLVSTDNDHAARRLLLEDGHPRIAFFPFHKPRFSWFQAWHSAEQRTMAEGGASLPESQVRWLPPPPENEPQLMVREMRDALVALARPSEAVAALFCVEDSNAPAALEAAEAAGPGVPGNLRLACFNGWPQRMFRDPWRRRRVAQVVHGIVFCAAKQLLERTSGDRGEPAEIGVPTRMPPAPPTEPRAG